MSWEAVFDEQLDLWRFWNNDDGANYAAGFVSDIDAKYGSAGTGNYAGFLTQERRKLQLADPIFVHPDVVDLIEAASSPELDQEFKPEPLRGSDLISPNGFLRFARPLYILDANKEAVSILAFAWAPMVATDEQGEVVEDRRGIHLTIYSDRDAERETQLRMLREEGFAQRFVLLHTMPWWYGETFSEDNFIRPEHIDFEAGIASVMHIMRLFQVTQRLAQQTITARGKGKAPRAARRRQEREDFADDPFATVITLRRYESSGAGNGESEPANYSHRFIVRGHWRNQYYRSVDEHRQIWISPFIKGPEGAELRVKPMRAFEVVR